jgi:hypothetical protein
MSNNSWFYASRVLIGVILGLGILSVPLFSHASPEAHASLVAPPQSLDELVDKATLIFSGEVGPVEQCLSLSGYDWDGSLLATPADCSDPQVYGLPVTDFQLLVEEVLRDDGKIAAGKPIILRVLGFPIEEIVQMSQDSEFPFSSTGDRHLFVLSPNPDGESYGLYYGPWSRLNIDGEILRVSNGKREPLQFRDSDSPVTLDEFRQTVAKSDAEPITSNAEYKLFAPIINGTTMAIPN